jgi:hypothetical protein
LIRPLAGWLVQTACVQTPKALTVSGMWPVW